jgi:manganese oxidase
MRNRYILIGVAIAVVACATILALVLRDDDTTDFAGMEMTAAEIDQMTRESMGTAPLARVKTRSLDDRVAMLSHRVENGTKVFALQARPVRWEYRDGQSVAAWGYERQVPGPTIRVSEGERVRVEFTNRLPEPTTVHWHGVDVPFNQDGVPGVTQDPIEPGETYSYEFTATPAGTRMYHTHGSSMSDEARQLDMGLSGALIIEPRTKAQPASVDQTLVLDEWAVEPGGFNAAMMTGAGHAAHNAGSNVFTINGRAAPDFEPIAVKRGETVRLRLINVGSSATHPMHLHGHQFTVTALDGNPVPAPARQLRNVITLAPGETADVEFTANNPGVWMLHCHELHHADAGMMTLMQYEGFEPVDAEDGRAGHDEGH